MATAQPSGFTVTGIAADGICHPFRVIYKGFDCFTYKVERVLRNISAKPVTVQPSGFTVTKACTQAAFPAAWRLQTSGSRCKSSVVYTPFRSALNVCRRHTAPSRDSGWLNCYIFSDSPVKEPDRRLLITTEAAVVLQRFFLCNPLITFPGFRFR